MKFRALCWWVISKRKTNFGHTNLNGAKSLQQNFFFAIFRLLLLYIVVVVFILYVCLGNDVCVCVASRHSNKVEPDANVSTACICGTCGGSQVDLNFHSLRYIPWKYYVLRCWRLVAMRVRAFCSKQNKKEFANSATKNIIISMRKKCLSPTSFLWIIRIALKIWEFTHRWMKICMENMRALVHRQNIFVMMA